MGREEIRQAAATVPRVGASSPFGRAVTFARKVPPGIRSRLAFRRALRRHAPNRAIRRRHLAASFLYRQPERVPGLRTLERRLRGPVFANDLHLLHDVLERSPLAGRYWVWGGVLLGWAREGRVLPHDQKDLDLAILDEDAPLLEATLPMLREAGFVPWHEFRANDGRVTEHAFMRHGGHFEFWRMRTVGDEWEYFVYGGRAGQPVQLRARVPRQPLESFELLDRTWQKVVDHDAELTTLYGPWRVPDPGWKYLDQGGVLEAEPWHGGAA